MSDSQIQPGGAPPPEPNSLSNKVLAGQALLPGTPVYADAGVGELGAADAGTAATAYALGLSLIPAANGERGQYRYSGPLTLSIAEWTAVLNTGTTGLTPGAPYFVSQAAAGKITKTLPGSGIAATIGVALSDVCMLIMPTWRTIAG